MKERSSSSHTLWDTCGRPTICACVFLLRALCACCSRKLDWWALIWNPLSLAGTSGGTIAMSYGTVDILCVDTPSSASPASQAAVWRGQVHRCRFLRCRHRRLLRRHLRQVGYFVEYSFVFCVCTSRLLKRGYELLFAFNFFSRAFEKSFVRSVSEPWVGHRVFLGWPLHP